jgi:hypothetical protein
MAAGGVDEGEARFQLGLALLRRQGQHPAHEADVVLIGFGGCGLVLLRVHAAMMGGSAGRA